MHPCEVYTPTPRFRNSGHRSWSDVFDGLKLERSHAAAEGGKGFTFRSLATQMHKFYLIFAHMLSGVYEQVQPNFVQKYGGCFG